MLNKQGSWPDRSLQRLLRRTINRAKSVACLGTCDLDKQPLGDGCDTYRDYLREDQVESQAVSVPKMSRYKGMCTSGGCIYS